MGILTKLTLILGVFLPVWLITPLPQDADQLRGGDGSEPTTVKKYECFDYCEGDDKCPEVAACHISGSLCVMVRRMASFHCVEMEEGTMNTCDTVEETGVFGGVTKNLGCIKKYRNPCDPNETPSCTRLVERCGKRTKCE